MPKLNVFMKSLQNQTRFAEWPGVEQHTDGLNRGLEETSLNLSLRA